MDAAGYHISTFVEELGCLSIEIFKRLNIDQYGLNCNWEN